MKYLIKMRIISVLFIIAIMFFSLSCKKGPQFDEKLYGTWKITRANVHSVFSFRANGSWTSSNRVEGNFSRIIENRGKVVGQWEVKESDNKDEKDTVYLYMTPTTVESVKDWEVGKTVKFKIINVDENKLVLLQENQRELVWTRVRGKKADDDGLEIGVVSVKTGPIVVNLKNLRAHGKFRYLCIDLDLSVEDAEDCAYIAIEKKNEEEVSYHLHPKISEVAIMYFSSLTYKDTKTLDKVKETIKTLQTILNPYFNGKLMDINVIKVVVTSNQESVKDFENIYTIPEAEPKDS